MKNKKIFLVAIIFLAFSIVMSQYKISAVEQYSDVEDDAWYLPFLKIMSSNGVDLCENEKFRPGEQISRADFMRWISVFADLKTQNTETGEHWAEMYWHMLDEVGLLEGLNIQPDSEELDSSLSRYEMLVIIGNIVFNLNGEEPIKLTNPSETIGDYDVIGSAYRGILEQMFAKGIVSGIDDRGSFCGNRPLTRAEAAKVIVCGFMPEYREDRSDITVDVINGDEPSTFYQTNLEENEQKKDSAGQMEAAGAISRTQAQTVIPAAPERPQPTSTQETLPTAEAAQSSTALPAQDSAPAATSQPVQTEPPAPPPQPIESGSDIPSQSFAFRYRGMSTTERRIALFGDENKTHFKNADDANGYVENISVSVWDLTSSGDWYSKTLTIQVNRVVSEEVKGIFSAIYNLPESERFPISYVGSARYSDTLRHSWGCALDINANYNYYKNFVTGKQIGQYCYQNSDSPYCIKPDSPVVRTFAEYGWGWGGSGWTSSVDYMHFSILSTGG